jgi:RND family efflux transporter MFP subunit
MKLKLFFIIIFIACVPDLYARTIDAFTSPSADVSLSFVTFGKVKNVKIKVGDLVKKGTLLLTLDDSLERSRLNQLNAAYQNTVKEKSEACNLKQRKRDLSFLNKAAQTGATSSKEIELAELEVKQLEYSLQMLAFEKSQILEQIKEQKIALSQMRLTSPLSGIVESISIEKGESVQQLKEIIRIIKISPLWIDVNIPLGTTHQFNLNDKCEVLFPSGTDQKIKKEARVIFRSSVADPGSDTLMYRLEVSNPENRVAGERVTIKIPGTGN